MARQSMKKLILSTSIAAALAVSGSAFGDGTSTEDLEARIAELEALVQQLLNEQAAPKDETCCADAQAAAAAAEEKFNALMAEHKAAEAEAEHKHSYVFGGYMKLDMMYSDYGEGPSSGAGRDWYIPGTIPVEHGADSYSYFDAHVKESRINFKSTHNLDNGAKIGTFLEMDFQLSGQGDERISNSWSPRVRHAFFTYNNWLFGQTWMTFFNVGALPENLDFVGPAESTLFGRQPMIRYTMGGFQFAIENPSTTITPKPDGGRVTADDNRMPDLVARWNMGGDWGNFTAAGILRELRCDNCIAGVDDSTNGWGVSLSGKFNLFGKDDFRWMATAGSGLGRYFGINLANGAVVDANGGLEAIDSWGVFGSYRHLWSDQWRSNLTLGYSEIDNDVTLTGATATKNASSVHVNLIYSPVPKMDFGVELLYATREIESGADGDMTRLQFSAKYAY